MISDPKLFRYLVEASTDGIWLLDGEGRTLWSNTCMADLLGRTPEEMATLTAYDVHDEVGKVQFAEHMARARAGDPGHDDMETMYLRPDGEPIWLLASWRPVHDDAGDLVGYLHRYTDFTERRELIDALRDREKRLAEAQAIAQIGSWEWDVVTDTVTWSDELYRIYRLTPEQFASTYEGFLDYIHPEDRHAVQTAVDSIFDGADEFEWHARIVRTDGAVRWLRGLGRAERDASGKAVRMAGTDQDITEKVVADHELAEATRRTALLRQVAVVANQSMSLVETLLRTAEAVSSTPGWDALVAYLPEHDDSALVPLVLVPGEPPLGIEPDPGLAAVCYRRGEITVRQVRGHEDTHSLVAIPVRHAEGVACVVEVLADEAPPDMHSQDLLDQISTMLGRVAERERAAAELAEARDQAMEASRMKSRFLATMSHEIRTPMNGVIGLTDLLLRTDLDEDQRSLTDALHGAGLTLRAIINDILDLSKIEAGKLELEHVDFSVRATLDQTVRLLAGPAADKGLALVVEVAPEVPDYLRGDSTRLGQVIANLGSNAVKFTDSGEVRIEVGLASHHADAIELEVAVSDTGPGIAPDAQQRLFDAFTQADPSTTRRHGGTGLGLTIARQLVGALGGRLTLESQLGRGSTFRFTADLDPAIGTVHDPQRPTEGRRPADAPRARVLVVEDNQVNQMVAVGMLENGGFDAAVAGDGVEAVAALAGDHGFAAVLMDCRMPRMDGFAATRAIRTQERPGHRIPIIAMTASALEGERERCLDAGMDDFLTKPVDLARLERVLHQWISGHGESPATDVRREGTGVDEGPELAGPDVVDVERIEMLHEMVKDGESLFQRSSGNFIAHARDHLGAIRAAVHERDAEALLASAHKLKGSALNLGLPRVGAAAYDLEERGRLDKLEGSDAAYATLVQEMEIALMALADARAARA
ncbi:ATP-binding protein [Nocardioides euryhalodurans]|nr:ATP-binding protein [Nocardioides euryhalodurans]